MYIIQRERESESARRRKRSTVAQGAHRQNFKFKAKKKTESVAKWRKARIDKIKTLNWNGMEEEEEAWVGVGGWRGKGEAGGGWGGLQPPGLSWVSKDGGRGGEGKALPGGGAEAKIFVSYEQSFGVYCEAQVTCC